MARYTSLFKIAVPVNQMVEFMTDSLKACQLDIVYASDDYLMAKELLVEKVAFAKLVTVEVLFDRSARTESEVRVNLVVKNEELPLQSDNHCRKMFEAVNKAVADNPQWKLLESAAS
jgi:ribosome-associated translation inhibitor RaiA